MWQTPSHALVTLLPKPFSVTCQRNRVSAMPPNTPPTGNCGFWIKHIFLIYKLEAQWLMLVFQPRHTLHLQTSALKSQILTFNYDDINFVLTNKLITCTLCQALRPRAQRHGKEEGQQWQQRGGGEWRDAGKVWNQLGDWTAVACIVVRVSQRG